MRSEPLALKALERIGKEQKERLYQRYKYWEDRTKPLDDAIRQAEIITEDDLRIIVGPCR